MVTWRAGLVLALRRAQHGVGLAHARAGAEVNTQLEPPALLRASLLLHALQQRVGVGAMGVHAQGIPSKFVFVNPASA
jgi:hypothetical protein